MKSHYLPAEDLAEALGAVAQVDALAARQLAKVVHKVGQLLHPAKRRRRKGEKTENQRLEKTHFFVLFLSFIFSFFSLSFFFLSL